MAEVLIKDKAIDDFLTECVAAFAELLPDLHAEFVEHVRRQSGALIKSTGMSPGGHFMNRMFIPARVYHFIRRQARKRLGIEDFWADPRNYKRLCRIWPLAETSTRPRTTLDLGAVKCQKPSRSPS